MNFLSIVFLVILIILTISIIAIIVLIVQLSKKIYHIQLKGRTVHEDIANAMTVISTVTSVSSLRKNFMRKNWRHKTDKGHSNGKTGQ